MSRRTMAQRIVDEMNEHDVGQDVNYRKYGEGRGELTVTTTRASVNASGMPMVGIECEPDLVPIHTITVMLNL